MMPREKILGRFRHMMVDSGVCSVDITDDKLLSMARGVEDWEKLKSMEHVISLVPEKFWQARGE